MKKEMILQTATTRSSKNSFTWFAGWACCKSILSSRRLMSLSRYYSRLLELPVTSLQTLYLLHAQLAFVCLVFPVECSLSIRVLFLVWFALSVLQCKCSGLK